MNFLQHLYLNIPPAWRGELGEIFIGGKWRRLRRVIPSGTDMYRLTFYDYPVVCMHGNQTVEWRKTQ